MPSLLTLRTPGIFVRRDLAGLAKSPRLHVYRTFLAGIAALLVALTVLSQAPRAAEAGMRPSDAAETASTIFRSLLAIQAVTVSCLAPLWGLAAVTLERSRGTWGLLELTRLGPTRAVFGKLLSVVVQALSLVLGLAPLQLIAFFFGGIAPEDMLAGGILLVDLAVLGGALGLAIGVSRRSPLAALVRLAVAAGSFYLLLPIGIGVAMHRAGIPQKTMEHTAFALHPLLIAGHVVVEPPPAPLPMMVNLPFALGVTLPAQALVFLAWAFWGSRARPGEHRGRRFLAFLRERRWDAATWCVVLLGAPALLFVAASLPLGSGEADLWPLWFVLTAGLTFVATPLLAAIPLSRERQTGAMAVLLTTPLSARRICARALQTPLGLIAASLVATEAQIVAYQAWVMPKTGMPMFHPVLPFQLACAEVFMASMALLISMAARSPFHAVGGTLAMAVVLMTGPIPTAGAVRSYGWDILGEMLPLLSPLSVLETSGGGSTAPLFACLAVLSFILASNMLEPLQRRWQERGAGA